MSCEAGAPAREGQRVFRNFGFLSAGKFLGNVFTFLFFVVLARAYGQEGLGLYSFAMALTGLLIEFADFGLYNLSVKDMSRNRDYIAHYYSRILGIRLILSASLIGVLLLADMLFPISDQMRWILFLIGAYQIIMTLVSGFGAVFVASEEMHVTALLELSLRAVTAIAGIIVILCGGGIVLAVATLPIVAMVHAVIGYGYAKRRHGAMTPSFTLAEIRDILRESFPYAAHAILEQLSSRIPLIFVGFILGVAAAGVFNAAYRVVYVLLFIPVFAGLAIFPVASRLYADSSSQLHELYRNTFSIAIMLGLPMTVGLWLIAPQLVTMLYGEEFLESIIVLRWLALLILTVFVRMMLEYFLIACDRQKALMINHVIVALASAFAYYWFIARWGLVGAVGAAVLVEFLLVVLLGRQLIGIVGWPRIGTRVLTSLAGTTAFAIPLWNLDPPLYVSIPGAMLIYGIILLMVRDIREQVFHILGGYFSADTSAAEALAYNSEE